MSKSAYQTRPKDFKIFKLIFQRQIKLSLRNLSELIHPLFYFIIASIAFKIAIGPNNYPLIISIGTLFIINIFAILLTNEALVSKDYKLGFLEQFYLIGCEFSLVVLAKYLAHFLIYSAVLICFIPALLLFNEIPSEYWAHIMCSQILLSAVVTLLLLLASSMLLGAQNKTLLSIVVLVLIFPALILSTMGVFHIEYLALLVALLFFLLPINIIASKYLIILAIQNG